MIEINNLSKTFNAGGELIKAVDNVSLSINKGENIAIVGHSGSGKSTLLSLMGGLAEPDCGTVKIDNINLWSISDDELSELRNQKINFIYQFASLVPTLTALENVLLPTAFGTTNSPDTSDEKYAMELLDLVQISEKHNSYPAHLSGGQQRRVAIARAFINHPAIILADEPTGDLDEETEDEIINLFGRMNKEHGITFVVVTHSMDVARQIGSQYRMTRGVLEKI